jgi:major cell surface glycoprotein (TIGR04216 family)
MSSDRLRAISLAFLMVVSVFAGTVAFTGTIGAQEAGGTVADAPPDTIFNELRPNGSAADAENIGLVKRGRSGGLLYNPATDNVNLEVGDVLVSRDNVSYEVTTAQRLEGSSGFVGPGATVFQGEQDTTFVGFQSNTLVGVPDQGAEGQTLDVNQTVPEDQDTGVYQDPENESIRLTIQEPRISRLEILNENGQRIEAGGQVQEDEFVIVRADVNFLDAERTEFALVDPQTGSRISDGLLTREQAIQRFPGRANFIRNTVPEGQATPEGNDGTQRSVANPAVPSRGTIYLIQDLSAVDKAGDYEYEVLADDDEPFGDLFQTGVQRRTAFTLVSEDDATLSLFRDERTAVQGEFLDYRVERGTAGERHVVSLSAEDLRTAPRGSTNVEDVTRVFRGFNDGGFERGVLLNNGAVLMADGRVFADGELVNSSGPSTVNGRDIAQVFTIVEIDSDGVGINSIDTGRLDDTSVDLRLYSGFGSSDEAIADFENEDGDNELEELTVRIEEGSEGLEITNPGATYVAGDDIDVEGTANSAIDFVSVYARDQGDWELLEPSLSRVSVDSDGTWDERDVVLSDETRILRVPGTYRIGVIDTEDADTDNDGEPDSTLTTSEFSQGTSAQRGIRVVGQGLDAEIVTFNGQVAVEDGTVNVSGTAEGADDVVIAFLDDQGSTVATSDTVDTQNQFENEDTALGDEDGLLSEGPIQGFVMSPGRDGVFGDGRLESFDGREATTSALIAFIDDLEQRGLTQEQATEILLEETLDDEGSDDLAYDKGFTFTDADTVVRDVVPEGMTNATGVRQIEVGETMMIRGSTNLRPDDNTIVLEMINGTDADQFEVAIAEDWNQTGEWNAQLAVPEGVTPGVYRLRADDGETITTIDVEIVEQRAQPSTPNETETPSTPTETAAPTTPTETAAPTTPTGTAPPTATPTSGQQPGFGLVVALLALIAAALLAVRSRR